VNIPALPLLPDEQVVSQLQDFGTQSQGEVMSGHETTVQISWPGMLFLGWLAVVGAMMLSAVIRTRLFYQQIRAKKYPVSQTLLQRCNLPVVTPVFWSHTVDTPVTIGFFAPHIILPDEMQDWDDGEISAILWHEYAHVRRRDNLLLIVQHLAYVIFFFHPVIWVSRLFSSLYQEQACDDLALLSNNYAPVHISNSLIKLIGKSRKNLLQVVTHASFVSLSKWSMVERIKNIHIHKENKMVGLKNYQKIILVCFLLIGLTTVNQVLPMKIKGAAIPNELKKYTDLHSEKNTIRGIVYDQINDEFMQGVEIVVYPLVKMEIEGETGSNFSAWNRGEIIMKGISDSHGEYRITDIPNGPCIIESSIPNFNKITISTKICADSSLQIYNFAKMLEPLLSLNFTLKDTVYTSTGNYSPIEYPQNMFPLKNY
jgi:beta-lactamase regulating signal transducer with metallopeptidase domain